MINVFQLMKFWTMLMFNIQVSSTISYGYLAELRNLLSRSEELIVLMNSLMRTGKRKSKEDEWELER